MANSRSQFQRLLFPGIKAVIMNAFNEKMQQYTKMAHVESSSKAFEEDFTAAGEGYLSKRPSSYRPVMTSSRPA